MKKGLVILIVLMLVVQVGFADTVGESYDGFAKELEAFGVFQGTGKGYELDRAATRLEGLVMLIRLLGEENVALNEFQSQEIPFHDVPEWGKAYVAFAYKQGLTQGLSEYEFGSDLEMSSQSYITFLLRALGYSDQEGDFSYAEALDYAVKIQLMDLKTVELLKNKPFTRGLLAKLSVQALDTTMKSSAMTLWEKLQNESSMSQEKVDYQTMIRELSSPKYAGRIPGTREYAEAAEYLVQQFDQIGAEPVFGSSLSYNYQTKMASLDTLNLRINYVDLELMEDFMPFSGTGEGTYSGVQQFVFVKSGLEEDYRGVDVSGKAVIFTWYDNLGKFPGGITDRILIAKEKGAREVFIVCNGELIVGHYEHPVKADSKGIFAQYLSEEAAENFGLSDYNRIQEFSALLDYECAIHRSSSVSAPNIVAQIPGRNPEKSILVVTNLDGFGKLPDGYAYPNAVYSCAAPAMMVDLAAYFAENQPAHNVIFAVVGDKWREDQGIMSLKEKLRSENIVSVLDLYAVGAEENRFTLAAYSSEGALRDYMAQYFNLGLLKSAGNALSGDLIEDYPVLFYRGVGTWIDDAKQDTWDGINYENYDREIQHLKAAIEKMMEYEVVDSQYNLEAISLFEPLADRSYLSTETKYYEIHFDEAYKSQIMTTDFLMEADKIYERIASYNYYPVTRKKPLLIISDDTISAAKIGGRKDIYENGHDVGGGFASFPGEKYRVVFCKAPSFYTLSHELNHYLAGITLGSSFDYEVRANQEAQGHTDFIHYTGPVFSKDMGWFENIINSNEYGIQSAMNVARTYKSNFSWNWFLDLSSNPYKHQNSYRVLGSMYSFIDANYGPKTMRRAIYRAYEASTEKQLQDAFIKELGLTSSEFLEEWSEWMLSEGEDQVDADLFDLATYTDQVTSYDLKWNKDTAKLDKEYEANYSVSSLKRDIEIVTQKPKRHNESLYFKTDIDPLEIAFNKIPTDIHSLFIGEDEQNIIIKIEFDPIIERNDMILFLMGDAPGLKERYQYDDHLGTLYVMISKEEARGYDVGFVLRRNEESAMLINRWDVEKYLR